MKNLYVFVFCSLTFFGCSKTIEDTDVLNMQQQVPSEDDMAISMDSTPSLSGEFIDAAHPTMGIAKVNGEQTQIELIAFKSDDGPLLELYLANDLNATEYISLGELQGLEGDFVYDLPNNVDFETYKYLMVWCVDFSVNFGHAILE